MSHNENEIERSWIINSKPKVYLISHSIYHEIGYLIVPQDCDADPGELRVYRKETGDFGITVKNMDDLSRKEWEDKSFPEWAFNILWEHTKDKRVYKTRHFSPLDFNGTKLLLEIDEYFYNLSGLVRLECEFDSEELANQFTLPSWVDEPIEVTYDKRFKNYSLAQLSRENYLELINELG